MRARDARAISFWIGSTVALAAAALIVLHSYVVTLGLVGAYNAWLLTRPRMIRVFRRLRGEPDWSGYFDNGGSEPSRYHASERPAAPPRPAERP